MGHNITVTIEGLGELETIIEVNREFNSGVKEPITPKIGIRIRLHSSGIGLWAKSGGYSSKFGLTSTEILEAYELLNRNGLLDKFYMIHFHIGSQMGEIAPLKKLLERWEISMLIYRVEGVESLNCHNYCGGLCYLIIPKTPI